MKIYEGEIADIVRIGEQPTIISKNGNFRVLVPNGYLNNVGDYEKVIDMICEANPEILKGLASNLKTPIARNWNTWDILVMEA